MYFCSALTAEDCNEIISFEEDSKITFDNVGQIDERRENEILSHENA
jgi:hypothetical protein